MGREMGKGPEWGWHGGGRTVKQGLSPVSKGSLDESQWTSEYPNCAGKRQSPINVRQSNVKFNPKLEPLTLEGYETQQGQFEMINNGHTGECTGPRRDRQAEPEPLFHPAQGGYTPH